MKKQIAKRIRRNILHSITRRMRNWGLSKPALTILTYHSFSGRDDIYSISPSMFKAQMETVAQTARFISAGEVGEILRGERQLQAPSVLVTIDDGYKDVLSVLPILKRLHIPALVFVLGDPDNVNRKELDHPGALLSWPEIRMLASRGLTIGCHSMTHARFSTLDPDGIYTEVSAAKRAIEHEIGQPVRYFAYPKGECTKNIVQAVQYAGYDLAFSVGQGCLPGRVYTYAVPRVVIDSSYTAEDISLLQSPLTARAREAFDSLTHILPSRRFAPFGRRFI